MSNEKDLEKILKKINFGTCKESEGDFERLRKYFPGLKITENYELDKLKKIVYKGK